MPAPTAVDNLISFTRQLAQIVYKQNGNRHSVTELLNNTQLAIEQVEGRASLPERVNVRLTPNQMAVLLNIYRGVTNEHTHEGKRGDYREDMRYLYRNKLISFDGEVTMTPLGVQRVMEVME